METELIYTIYLLILEDQSFENLTKELNNTDLSDEEKKKIFANCQNGLNFYINICKDYPEELKLTLLLELTKLEPPKKSLIKFAESIKITQISMDILLKFAEEKQSNFEIAFQNLVSGVAAAGIPLGSIYGLGLTGFSAAGITSGLSALALGAGMVPGIGVTVLGGIGIYKAVSWLQNKFKKQ